MAILSGDGVPYVPDRANEIITLITKVSDERVRRSATRPDQYGCGEAESATESRLPE